MEELINFFIELIHTFKYGQLANKKRNFEKQLKISQYVDGEDAFYYINLANEQLSKLIVKGNGTPAIAYFEARKKGWYKIFIINSNKEFYCRLKDVFIDNHNNISSLYVKLR